ncbi:MAG TPA: carboxypeptidase-like regulatory domain-containing protein, partial [Blastocatellia bacterium]|nr:carboxypeptidase-like regulatory domain-containing protein [Blastocatellia bacterium]
MPRDHSDRRAPLSLLILCSSLVLCAPTAFGQAASTGAIVGTVTNAAGETVPDAEVTVTHTATQRSLTVKTTDAGFYTVEGLVAGFYDVSIR